MSWISSGTVPDSRAMAIHSSSVYPQQGYVSREHRAHAYAIQSFSEYRDMLKPSRTTVQPLVRAPPTIPRALRTRSGPAPSTRLCQIPLETVQTVDPRRRYLRYIPGLVPV